jgi:exodeoxyribonuclease-5
VTTFAAQAQALAQEREFLTAPRPSSKSLLERAEEILEPLGYPRLTPKQSEIVLDILKNYHKVDYTASLKGAAGTGKTTTLVTLIVALVLDGAEVGVSAFTHKACSVLRLKLDELRDHVEDLPQPATLHSLLNLKPKKAEYGQPETFSQKRPPDFGNLDLMIIDECSMIGDDLAGYIEDGLTKCGYSVLYAGDPSQLKPVGETRLSRTFKAPTQYKLSQVLRHDGAILNLATKIRKLKYIPQFEAVQSGGSRVDLYDTPKALIDTWCDRLKNGTVAEQEGSVMLCYTNANRRMFNDKARAAIHGPNTPRFMKDDVVLTLAPVLWEDEVLYANNQDVRIIVEPELIEVRPIESLPFSYQAWALRTADGHLLHVLADLEQEKLYAKNMRALGKEIAAEQKKAGSDFRFVREIKRRWALEYFPLKSFFADIDFRYALTIHKSQGSTFSDVYVYNDYLKAHNDQQRLLYVAVTRAAQRVSLVSNRK